MKTGPSKLFRKLAINRRSNRIGETARANAEKDCSIKPVENYWKATTILKQDSEGYCHVKCGGYLDGQSPSGFIYESKPNELSTYHQVDSTDLRQAF